MRQCVINLPRESVLEFTVRATVIFYLLSFLFMHPLFTGDLFGSVAVLHQLVTCRHSCRHMGDSDASEVTP